MNFSHVVSSSSARCLGVFSLISIFLLHFQDSFPIGPSAEQSGVLPFHPRARGGMRCEGTLCHDVARLYRVIEAGREVRDGDMASLRSLWRSGFELFSEREQGHCLPGEPVGIDLDRCIGQQHVSRWVAYNRIFIICFDFLLL